MRPRSLIAYDANGDVIATLDHVVAYDEVGDAVGLVDFAAHEEAEGSLKDIWVVGDAVGSGTWPEWLGQAAHDFRVETVGEGRQKRISALVHKTSGRRRVKADIEAAIEAAPVVDGEKDIRHLVGGPDRPLVLDSEGRTVGRSGGPATPRGLPVSAGGGRRTKVVSQ